MSVILVVDDEMMIRDLTSRILSRAHHTVIAAENAQQARELFAEHAGEISVVILDYSLPDSSGTDLLKQLRAMRADFPCIISSGFPLSPADMAADVQYRTSFLQKPYRSTQLLEAVQEAITSTDAH